MGARRISITVGSKQENYIRQRADMLGIGCPTSYVSYLVTADIALALNEGRLGVSTDSRDELGQFIRALIEDEGVSVDQVRKVCEILSIPYDKMIEVLGFNDQPNRQIPADII